MYEKEKKIGHSSALFGGLYQYLKDQLNSFICMELSTVKTSFSQDWLQYPSAQS